MRRGRDRNRASGPIGAEVKKMREKVVNARDNLSAYVEQCQSVEWYSVFLTSILPLVVFE